MADKLRVNRYGAQTGTTYALIRRRSDACYWNGSAFVALTTTRGDFDIPLTLIAAGEYVAAYPVIPVDDWYDVLYFHQPGGSPHDTNDTLIAVDGGYWDGLHLLANPRVITDEEWEVETEDFDDALDAHGLTTARAENLDNLDAQVSDIEAAVGANVVVANIHNQDPVKAYTAKLGSRADGVYRAYPTIRIAAGEKAQIWIDCSARIAHNIGNVTDGVSGSAEIELEGVGMQGKLASILIDATDAESGDEADITCNVTPWGTRALPVAVHVEVGEATD